MRTTRHLFILAVAAVLLAACGADNSSSRRAVPSSASTTAAVAAGASGAPYSTKTFVLPLDVTVPAFLPAAPSVDQPNFVTWEATDAERAVRVMAPVNLYQPGAATATPVPADYYDYLRGLGAHGVHFDNVVATKVGGKPAHVVTITTDTSLDGALGCPADGLSPGDCFGPQPDLSLRMAVIDVNDQALLIWLRQTAASVSPDLLRAFDQMLNSVTFANRAVALPAAASTGPTPVDGVWTASWTFDDLKSSSLLYDNGELNDGNWGEETLTFGAGQFSVRVVNPKDDETVNGTFTVSGDVLTMHHGTEQFVMHWSITGDQLTLTRDTSLGIAPTPMVIRPWTRQG
jgi:hypothetical protein